MKKRKRTLRGMTLPAIHPNVGLRVAYRKAMEELILQMTKEVHEGVLDALRPVSGEFVMAQDATGETVAEKMAKIFDGFIKLWTKKFDVLARKIAPKFIKDIFSNVAKKRRKALRDAGIAIPFNKKPLKTNEWLQAAIQYNISLIKTIPQQYLSDVQELVMRSVAEGYDRYGLREDLYKMLTDELGWDADKAMKRARIISIDQSNKATQAVTMYNDIDLGFTHGKWVHVPGRKMSRFTHIQMDGQEFDLREGLYDPDKRVMRKVKPAELILCRCCYKLVVPQDWLNPSVDK